SGDKQLSLFDSGKIIILNINCSISSFGTNLKLTVPTTSSLKGIVSTLTTSTHESGIIIVNPYFSLVYVFLVKISSLLSECDSSSSSVVVLALPCDVNCSALLS